MSKRDKLRQRLRQNPKGRSKQDVETLLGQFGFKLDRVTGSHHVYVFDTHRIVVPIHGQSVKPVYVKQVLDLLDRLFPAAPDMGDGEDEVDE